MKKIISIGLASLLLSSTLSSYAHSDDVAFSVTNTDSNSYDVDIYPYLRESINNDLNPGNHNDIYTAVKWGLTSPCGHDASITVQEYTQQGNICPLQISFKIAKCEAHTPAKNIVVNIYSPTNINLTSSTNSIASTPTYRWVNNSGCERIGTLVG